MTENLSKKYRDQIKAFDRDMEYEQLLLHCEKQNVNLCETMQKIDRINKTLVHFKPILDLDGGSSDDEKDSGDDDDDDEDSDLLNSLSKAIISRAKTEFAKVFASFTDFSKIQTQLPKKIDDL
jgi:hypothetical protein